MKNNDMGQNFLSDLVTVSEEILYASIPIQETDGYACTSCPFSVLKGLSHEVGLNKCNKW